jgi:hypothetical protein
VLPLDRLDLRWQRLIVLAIGGAIGLVLFAAVVWWHALR